MASRRKDTQLGGANRHQRSVGNVFGLASCQVWEAGSGKCGPGRPKMTWKQLTGRDCIEWKLSDIHPHDRRTWRYLASYLEGGPTDVDVAFACLSKIQL